ncbi:hypothetical protein TBR22_A25660 [Luteitalea sp. TBR-22]|uniref:hypothetical protein n=1 Tax=Luteitalea sp. TBR-22 TaxID=2802971 RepID=UPI001AF6CE61|nr:hypothetical protein [Luteitalea sp. TBR-22]BCS33339.1 hypothetical protein TBR22_A25660 [Luteitalea sp. TBR-22]
MAAESRQRVRLLLGLLAVLVLVAWWQFGGSPAGSAAVRPPTPAQSAPTAPGQTPSAVLAEGIGLDRLSEDRPAPQEGGRDPFRGGAAEPAPPGAGSSGPAKPVAPVAPPPPVVPMGPPQPPPPPPITVKFIGVVSRHDVGKVAVLSDGKNVYYGRAGEIVDGRWRIVSIGEESLQIEYVDGRGRQTVRLTG